VYAWRGRIGLIKPTHRGKSFAFWYNHAPDGVEIVPTFIGFRRGEREAFGGAFEPAERLADDLKAVGCDIIAVSGTPPFLLKGLDFEREWADRVSQRTGLPVVTPMEPHALALQALGVQRVGIATYYNDELNQAIINYFARFDIEGLLFGGYSLTGQSEALYATPMLALDEVSQAQVYQYCKHGFLNLAGKVEGIYINGGGWDAAPAIVALENDLNTKVVFALAAEMWLTYKKLFISNPQADCGLLLREDHNPPAAKIPVPLA
jgi:maleate cis-trans isomerase